MYFPVVEEMMMSLLMIVRSNGKEVQRDEWNDRLSTQAAWMYFLDIPHSEEDPGERRRGRGEKI